MNRSAFYILHTKQWEIMCLFYNLLYYTQQQYQPVKDKHVHNASAQNVTYCPVHYFVLGLVLM